MDRFFQTCHTLDVSYACNTAEMWETALHTLAQDGDVQALVVESPALTRARVKRLIAVLSAQKRRLGALTCSAVCSDACSLMLEHVVKLRIPRLCLCQNAPGASSLFTFGVQMQRSAHLTHLDLGRNGIGCDTLATLVRGLCKHKNLQCLSLSHNPLGDAGLSYLVPVLSAPLRLERLYVAGTQGGDLGAAHLAKRVAEHPLLQVLDLSENPSLGAVGWFSLSHALARNKSLRVLNLAFTAPKPVSICHMAMSLAENHTLQALEYTHVPNLTEDSCEAEECIARCLTRNARGGFQGGASVDV
jgi:hypothetical protein